MYIVLFSFLFFLLGLLYYKYVKHTSLFISLVKSLFNTEVILFIIGIPISSILSENLIYKIELITIFIILFICLLNEEQLHEVHCYDFKFGDYDSFSNYINTELEEQGYEKKILKENIIIYIKDCPTVTVIIDCHFDKIDINQFRVLFNEIISYLNNNYYFTSSLNGLRACIMISAKEIFDINKIVTKTSDLAYVKRSTRKILFSTVINNTTHKIYICDNDIFLDKNQKKMTQEILKLINPKNKNKNKEY